MSLSSAALRFSLLAALSFAAMSCPAQLTSSAPPSPAPVHVRITRPAQPVVIPGSVFGSFLEPIGHSTYGGLWADVVENPSFEEGLWSAGRVTDMLRERPELRRASDLGLPTSVGAAATRRHRVTRYLRRMRGDSRQFRAVCPDHERFPARRSAFFEERVSARSTRAPPITAAAVAQARPRRKRGGQACRCAVHEHHDQTPGFHLG